MQAISAPVGQNCLNLTQDVSIVQAMLALTHRSPALGNDSRFYYRSITGVCTRDMIEAIQLFQSDQEALSRMAASRSSYSADGVVRTSQSGQIVNGDNTWNALVSAVPAEFKDLRALLGCKIVYIADPPSKLQANVQAAGALNFEANFKQRLLAFLKDMYAEHAIAMSVNAVGARRTFQEQYDQRKTQPTTTNAGPGESNHNFGFATDVGFTGMRWFAQNGVVIMREGPQLNQMDPKQQWYAPNWNVARFFWEAMFEVAVRNGLFRGPDSDGPHLQNFDDRKIDMAARLGVLLTKSSKMKWKGILNGSKKGRHYECDLGYGGTMFEVGNSMEIWEHQALVDANMLNQARAQPSNKTGVTAPATPTDVKAMQDALRACFDAADKNYLQWTR